MELKPYETFAELQRDIVPADEIIRDAWTDIVVACEVKPSGYKKKKETQEALAACERAIKVLQRKFLSPDQLQQVIPQVRLPNDQFEPRILLMLNISEQPLSHEENRKRNQQRKEAFKRKSENDAT